MNITNLYAPSFGANLNSPKLKFKRSDFFVKIRGYGRNREWADEVIKTADTAVNLIRKDTGAENVLKVITAGLVRANKRELNLEKRMNSGVLRTERDGWYGFNSSAFTSYDTGRYSGYMERLDNTKPLSAPVPNLGMSRPCEYKFIIHSDDKDINNSLDYIFNLSKGIFPKYIHKEVKPENMEEINSTIAEIRWVMAHATPWMRGSDAISNIFMRVMYKAIGIKTYPLVKGVSLDLEAYCTELKDYKKKFPAYFEKPPEIIE